MTDAQIIDALLMVQEQAALTAENLVPVCYSSSHDPRSCAHCSSMMDGCAQAAEAIRALAIRALAIKMIKEAGFALPAMPQTPMDKYLEQCAKVGCVAGGVEGLALVQVRTALENAADKSPQPKTCAQSGPD